MAKEESERKDGQLPDKYSPFIQTEIPDSNHKKNKELIKLKQESPKPQANLDPALPTGRPDGSKDTVKRKVSKRIRAAKLAEAEDFQSLTDEVLDELYFKKFEVANKRQLNLKQKEELERAKNKVFAAYNGIKMTHEEIINISQSEKDTSSFENKFNQEISSIKNPTTSNARMIKNCIMADLG